MGCRGEKKVISGKSVQKSAVTCLVWPSTQSNYVAGLADGKVRGRWTLLLVISSLTWLQVKSGAGKGSKTHTLYSSGSYVVSLAARYIKTQNPDLHRQTFAA